MLKFRRIGHWCYCHKLIIIARLFEKLIHFIWTAQIPMSCEIRKDVVFCHGGMGCVLHPNVVIDEGTWIMQNVTLGEKDSRYPIIGKGCLIGAGAVVLGGVKIGDGSKVGANAVVLCDVPENSIAVGIPAVIKK